MLKAGDGHWLYVEEVGRPDGIPAVFLHGGPGSGSQHAHRALFDPDRFHAILFDQRGAGRSHPYLSRQANTTQHLVADIERIREHFGFERWLVVGGSWGSTLALAYAQAHPGRVTGLVLRAIFLGTKEEVEWAFIGGPQRFRPELYEAFVSFLPAAEQQDPIASYCARILNDDRAVRAPASHVWNAYERALSELAPGNARLPTTFDTGARMPPTPIMEAHYIINDFFLAPGALLDGVRKLGAIPGHIVQGRYDLLCPPAAAHAIAARWPSCTLEFIESAGHAMSEAGVVSAMKAAIARLTADTRI
jgi:proline iminopeptidase